MHSLVLLFLSIQALSLWMASLIKKDSSLFDRVWGSSFVVIAYIVLYSISYDFEFRSLIYILMVSVWGLRLSWHITQRNLGKGEDRRYAAIRAKYSNYEFKSLFMIFIFQSCLVWVVSLPIIFGLPNISHSNYFFHIIGFIIWVTGFIVEVCADRQLKAFIKNRQSPLDVCDTGLWSFSRHPNYLGDAVLWWGLCIYVWSWSYFWIILSPILMTYLLRFFTGIGPLEEDQCAKKEQYKDYQERVPVFFPVLKI